MRASAFLLLMLLVPLSATAQESSFNAGAKVGVLMPGQVYISAIDIDVETTAGFMAIATVDAMVAEKMSMGAFAFIGSTTEEITDESAMIYTLGGTLKGRFYLSNGMQIRPGVAFGYQAETGDVFDDVSGFDLGAIFEVAIPAGSGRAFTAELSFISQPAGGNGDSDVTFTPRPYLAIGFEFSK